jgi:glyoxylase-like metal-dependent hydrolase (beta-lactamase superfamily II)
VFSHHHIDHVFGLGPFEQEAESQPWATPVVYAHRAVAANFRRYERTVGWNTAINLRQFGRRVSGFSFPDHYRYPDVSYEGSMTFEQGGVRFELFHGLGETDDATWTWMPELKMLHPGDLFIWALPNAGNPQ